jgi:putative ABC transport system substrate-binding protein
MLSPELGADMRRREFITLLGGAAVSWPLAASAQQPERMRRIGVLMFYAESDREGQKRVAALREELQNLGWEEGRNIRIEYHWYMGDVEKARASAAELVRLAPDVIVSNGAAGLERLQQATRTIPIVFTLIGEPVVRGFVQSLAHPGGNITGFTNLEASTAAKWMELIKEIAPSVKRVAIIYNPATSPFAILFARSAEVAAHTLALEPVSGVVHSPAEIEATIKTLATDPGAGLIVIPDGFAQTHRKLIIELAARYNLPAVYPFRFFPNDGGLVSYGVEPLGVFRQTAAYVDRILRGAKPADLPVQQPTKFELVINLKTAKSLGITVPPTLLVRADEVIE